MMAVAVESHSRPVVLLGVLAAVPPAVIEFFYLATGPRFDSSRSRFVAAFLASLVVTAVAGALLRDQRAQFGAMTMVLAGIVVLGIAAGFSFGLFLLIAAIPAIIAVARLFGGMPLHQAVAILILLSTVVLGVFAAGLALTTM